MWNVVITLTSAGYGDIYPKTYWGRVVGVSIAFWGVLLISNIVVTFTDTLSFSENEEKAYAQIMRLSLKSLLKMNAVKVLQGSYIYKRSKILETNKSATKIFSNFQNFRTRLL